MTAEQFLSLYGHLPIVYKSEHLVYTSGYSYGGYEVGECSSSDLSSLLFIISGIIAKQRPELSQVIESEPAHPDERALIYAISETQSVTIGKHDVIFFEKLQRLPAGTKIKMMNLSDFELNEYLKERANSLKKKAITLLSSKWYFRETGDEVPRDQELDIIYKRPDSIDGYLKKVKSKAGLSNDNLNDIIRWFEHPNTEVYLKEAGE